MMFLRVSPPWSVGPTLKLSTVFPMLTLKAGCRIPQLCGKLPPCPASLQPDELAHGNHAIEWFGRAVGKFHHVRQDIVRTVETVAEELRDDLARDDPRTVELRRRCRVDDCRIGMHAARDRRSVRERQPPRLIELLYLVQVPRDRQRQQRPRFRRRVRESEYRNVWRRAH